MFAAVGVASKWYEGPLRDVVIGQFLDYFGTVSMVLGARVVLVRASMWKVAGTVLAILMAIEFSQRLHGGFIERIRENLVDHVAALEISVKEKLDWRRPIRERPRVFLGGAILLGVAIGLL